MKGSRAEIVLVSGQDPVWIADLEQTLREAGAETFEAHNCWSAAIAQKLHGGEAFVIDGPSLCDFVTPDRPGPVLGLSPKVPVVVFNAQELDDDHRSAAMAHNAALVDGDDIAEIARALAGVLPAP